jgi:hypothetical protein
MTNEAYELSGFLLTLQRAGCSKATVSDVLKTVPTFLGIDADDRKRIQARLNDDRQERLYKANRKQVENVGSDPFGHAAEARKKRVRKSLAHDERVKAPGSVFAPHDCTGSPQERYEKLRRLDAEDARQARASSTPVDEDALDVEEDENAEGSATNPVDLTRAKNTERFSFGRVSRVKARGARGSRAKGSR